MEIQERRRRRLRRYVERHYGGNVSAFAQATGRQPSFFNDLFATPPRKAFGEKLARALEQQLPGIKPFELDASDESEPPPEVRDPAPRLPSEAELNRAWKTYPVELKAKIVAFVETVRQSVDVEANGFEDDTASASRLRKQRIAGRHRRGGKEDAG